MEYSLQFLEIIIALAGVLGLFYLVVKFIKSRNLLNRTNQIEVLERCHLDQKRVLYLVEVVGEIWLVTSTEQEIEFVKQMSRDEVEFNNSSSRNKLFDLFIKDENNEN